MIKTNIKMRVTPEQSKRVQEICFENGFLWATSGKIFQDCYEWVYIDNEKIYCYSSLITEEVNADLFIKTNGTCEETYLTKYTSQPKNLHSALKKIENLHSALKKKVEKNKNQALEITKLLEQKKDLQEALSINYELIEKFTKIGVKYENKFDENKKTIERLNSIVEYLSKQLGLKVF